LISKSYEFGIHFGYQVTIFHKPNNRHSYLRLKEGKYLHISTPLKKSSELSHLLSQHQSWIESHPVSTQTPLTILESTTLSFLGRAYPLIQKEIETQKPSLTFNKEHFIYHSLSKNSDELTTLFYNFLKKEAQFHLLREIERQSHKLKLFPTNVTLRKAKTRWGSCSGRNTISLNYRMMQFPRHCIEYIVIHELVHIKHKHHQPSFWKTLQQILPHYQETTKEIRLFEKTLF
jgi:predicted metal-dependent hydrolase